MVACETTSTGFPNSLAKRARKNITSWGMSPRRSRSGGTRMGTTFRR